MTRSVLLAVALAATPAWAVDDVNVVFINGINNTLAKAKATATKIQSVLDASENHAGTARKTFTVQLKWNPAGWYGDPSFFQDLMEMFLMKVAEEHFGPDFQQLITPFNASNPTLDSQVAQRVAAYLDDMTPGNNSPEVDGSIHDADMAATQKAIEGLATLMGACRPTIVIAHSEGNLLTNLAYARAASLSPELVAKRVRVVNIANTSEFSVNGLNFTHVGDNALFSPAFGLVKLPDRRDWTRTTPRCANAECDLTVAIAPFGEPPDLMDGAGDDHGMLEVYLSTIPMPVTLIAQPYHLDPDHFRCVDRFEDIVYAAAESFEPVAAPPPSGHFTAFVSYATNLVPGDTNGFADIFVKDANGPIERVSVSFAGAQGNGHSLAPSISADGQRIAFTSDATNLVSGDTNGKTDVFVHDRGTGVTRRVSITTGGTQGNGDCADPKISADGETVVFASRATNLVSGDTNNHTDIFVHELTSARTQRVSVTSTGTQGTGDSQHPSISADGCQVAFDSVSTFTGMNGQHVYVADRNSAAITLVSATANGPGNNASSAPSISRDGKFVAFVSKASNLVLNDDGGVDDVFISEVKVPRVLRVSVGLGGAQADQASLAPAISADGQVVAFVSPATNLVPNDTNDTADVFVRDLDGGVTTRVSLSFNGNQDLFGAQGPAVISGDGQVVGWYSLNSKGVANDTNNWRDVLVHDRRSGLTRRASVDATGAEADGESMFPALNP